MYNTQEDNKINKILNLINNKITVSEFKNSIGNYQNFFANELSIKKFESICLGVISYKNIDILAIEKLGILFKKISIIKINKVEEKIKYKSLSKLDINKRKIFEKDYEKAKDEYIEFYKCYIYLIKQYLEKDIINTKVLLSLGEIDEYDKLTHSITCSILNEELSQIKIQAKQKIINSRFINILTNKEKNCDIEKELELIEIINSSLFLNNFNHLLPIPKINYFITLLSNIKNEETLQKIIAKIVNSKIKLVLNQYVLEYYHEKGCLKQLTKGLINSNNINNVVLNKNMLNFLVYLKLDKSNKYNFGEKLSRLYKELDELNGDGSVECELDKDKLAELRRIEAKIDNVKNTEAILKMIKKYDTKDDTGNNIKNYIKDDFLRIANKYKCISKRVTELKKWLNRSKRRKKSTIAPNFYL